MVITKEDVHNFENMYEKYISNRSDSEFISWLNNNPHILMVNNFTDYSPASTYNNVLKELIDWDIIVKDAPLFRQIAGEWIMPYGIGEDEGNYGKWWWFPYIDLDNSYKALESLERYDYKSKIKDLGNEDLFSINLHLIKEYLNGQKDPYIYNYLKNIPNDIIKTVFDMRSNKITIEKIIDEAISISAENSFYYLTYDEVYKKLLTYVNNPLVDKRNFISPSIWTNKSLIIQNKYLKESIGDLIINIQENKEKLQDITGTQLEEIVAEIFRSRGMQVILNKNRPQGGRDIIGRFNNGFEFTNVAIEVKHQSYIDKPVLSSFLQQNRMFPLLYLITSGKFSAGVVNESNMFENKLRVKLYDGVAVKSLLNIYKP